MKVVVFALLLLGYACIPAIGVAQTLESAAIANGATSNITGADGQCRSITNNCPSTIMVPSKTNAEWQSYYGGAKPSCVTIAACAVIRRWNCIYRYTNWCLTGSYFNPGQPVSSMRCSFYSAQQLGLPQGSPVNAPTMQGQVCNNATTFNGGSTCYFMMGATEYCRDDAALGDPVEYDCDSAQ